MLRSIKKILVTGLLAGLAPAALAFSLGGPPKGYQVEDIGYMLPGDVVAPMGLNEGYRWNVPLITYAFDRSFILYFGTNGMKAVDDAFKTLNALPAAGAMSADLSEFPTRTHAENYEAAVLGIYDLKSEVLSLILEQMGLADPERWTFALRGRVVQTFGAVSITNYTVIKLNYDPVTLRPSSYVNSSLYTYTIVDPVPPLNHADAEEGFPIFDDDGVPDRTVARGSLFPGIFYRGLTRDDVGGLRFLLRTNNLAVEDLITGVTVQEGFAGGLFSGWIPFTASITNVPGGGATNSAATNFITVGIRPGISKVTFKKVYFDSLIGTAFTPFTNNYTDSVISTKQTRLLKQRAARAITAPDILFTAEDLGLSAGLVPIRRFRSGVGNWVDNTALNGAALAGGPGVIQGPIVISFTDQYPYFSNTNPGFLTEPTASSGVWGSFDGSTNAPIIYPAYLNLTIDDLRRLYGRGNN